MLFVISSLGLLFDLVVVGYAATQFTVSPPDEESLMCSGAGTLMFQGDGRFSIVRENANGSLMCEGGVSLMADSALYTRVISDGIFVCNSSNSVRICGYGHAELISSNGFSSILQCNGKSLFPPGTDFANTFCYGNGTFSIQGYGNYTINANMIVCSGNVVNSFSSN